jgi:glutamyl-tRNA reductase
LTSIDEAWALTTTAGEVEVGARSGFAADLRELLGFHRHWALLETCHRVELYGFGPVPSFPRARLLTGQDAVRQLFRVAAGLESAVVGENEVLHQVRGTLTAARERGADQRLCRLLECAIAAGREARSESIAPEHGLAERAVGWLARRTPIAGRLVLVAGTGVMGTAFAAAARDAGADVTVAGRDPSRAPMLLDEAARLAPQAAGIGVALRGEWTGLEAQGGGLPPIADLSSPPAVPAAVRAAIGPDYLGIDQLWERDRAATAWVSNAERVVHEGVDDYVGWLRGRRSVRTLVELRERGERRRQERVDRLLRRLPGLTERERELIVTMSRQLVTDLLHEPVAALRADQDGGQSEAARRLFNL